MTDYELLTQHVHYHNYINKELLQIYKRYYLRIILVQSTQFRYHYYYYKNNNKVNFNSQYHGSITETFPIYIPSRLSICYLIL